MRKIYSPTARAVRFDRYGDRGVLYVTDIPMPSPGPGEVVVQVRAAGINPGETNIRIDAFPNRFPATFPSGQGSDLAGVITALGPNVTEFIVGEEVLGYSWRRSSHATHVVVPVTQLIVKPPQMPWDVAGSLTSRDVRHTQRSAPLTPTMARRSLYRPPPAASAPSWFNYSHDEAFISSELRRGTAIAG